MIEKINKYINQWERNCYYNGIPDEVDNAIKDIVPSYKRIAIAILNNDYPLKSLGFSIQKSELYSNLKRKELLENGKIKIIQLKLF